MGWKEYLSKYFVNLFTVAAFLAALIFFYEYYQKKQIAKKERELLEERYAKLIGEQTSGRIFEFGTQLSNIYKEQAELAKDARDAWKQLAIERQERIKLMSSLNISVLSEEESQEESDFVTPEGYIVNELRIGGAESPPIGFVMLKEDGSVYKKNYQFEIRVDTIQLKDDLTGKIRIVNRAFLVPLESGLAEKSPDIKDWKGAEYPLQIVSGESTIDPHEPIIADIKTKGLVVYPMNINAGFGLFSDKNTALTSKIILDTSLLGYGYHKRDLDWKFLNVGVNYSDVSGLGFHIMPFSYRLMPSVLTNTYFGLGFSSTPEYYEYFIGASTGL